jgi:hypothetical protein
LADRPLRCTFSTRPTISLQLLQDIVDLPFCAARSAIGIGC